MTFTEPEWLTVARREGRVLSETAVRTSALPSSPPSCDDTEEAFLGAVLELAQRHGWRRAHFRPAKTAKGWRTAVQGDGKGFPDLVLVRAIPPAFIVAELKSMTGKLSVEQVEWLDALQAAGVRCFVWRPADWLEVERVLRDGP